MIDVSLDLEISRFPPDSLNSHRVHYPPCRYHASRTARANRNRREYPNGWSIDSKCCQSRVTLPTSLQPYTCAPTIRVEEEFLKKRKRKLLEKEYIFPGIFNQFIVFIGIAEQTQIQYPEHNNIVLIYPAGHSSGERRKAGREEEEESWRLGGRRKKIPLICTFLLARGLTRLSALSFTRRLSRRAQ